MNATLIIFLAIIGAGIILCFLRMLSGPTASDRAVAVDTVTTTIVALLVLLGFIFERYDYLDNKIKYLEKLHDEGLLMQVNNSSLIKSWTAPVSRRAVNMLKLGIIDFIGSDCHYMKGRFSNFIPAYNKLVKILGKKEADLIAIENPSKILASEDIN